jgi:hypothetical protein
LSEPLFTRPHDIVPRSNETGVRLDPTLTFDRPELRVLLGIWDARRQGRQMPARADFDPCDLKAHLGHLFLVDVERNPIRFRYRLVGTHITNVVNRDVTGRYFEDIYIGRLLETMIEVHSWVANERAPLRIFSRTGHAPNMVYVYDGLLLPLSTDGETMNMVLGALLFTLLGNPRTSRL